MHAARARGVDGVICGHIHVAAIKQLHGVTNINTDDCVDSCTAVVEPFDGRMELIRDVSSVSCSVAPLEAEAVS